VVSRGGGIGLNLAPHQDAGLSTVLAVGTSNCGCELEKCEKMALQDEKSTNNAE
jgi:hypothetical protein